MFLINFVFKLKKCNVRDDFFGFFILTFIFISTFERFFIFSLEEIFKFSTTTCCSKNVKLRQKESKRFYIILFIFS